MYSSSQTASPLREVTCHTGSYSVTCHPAEVTFPPLPQPIKAGTRFSNPGGMQGWVYLVGLVTYRGGIPDWRRSPIPVLTGPNVEQLVHATNDTLTLSRYHYAKLPSTTPNTATTLAHPRHHSSESFNIVHIRCIWLRTLFSLSKKFLSIISFSYPVFSCPAFSDALTLSRLGISSRETSCCEARHRTGFN